MKIFTVVGARPNFIKIDPGLKQTIIHTGQHYDYRMSQIFFKGLKLPKPKYNLNETEVGKMIDKLRQIFKREKPDLVMVIGDTNSTLAGAVAASLENLRVAHIEAGMRLFDTSLPEERIRTVVDKIAYIHFCPNQQAALNLLKEGIKDRVFIVGDPLFDSMGRFTPIKKSKDFRKYSLLTLHRNFNVDEKNVLYGLLDTIGLSGEKFIFPVHPRTKKMLKGYKKPKNIKFIEPQGYKEMLDLISNSKTVVTDSGGVQREAYWMSVPVIIPRDSTEWQEIISRGSGILVGNDNHKLLEAIKNFKGKVNPPPEPNTNRRIRNILSKYV